MSRLGAGLPTIDRLILALGSLRVIVKAKERGLIPLVRPALEKFLGAGAYVSDDLIDWAIALAGET